MHKKLTLLKLYLRYKYYCLKNLLGKNDTIFMSRQDNVKDYYNPRGYMTLTYYDVTPRAVRNMEFKEGAISFSTCIHGRRVNVKIMLEDLVSLEEEKEYQ